MARVRRTPEEIAKDYEIKCQAAQQLWQKRIDAYVMKLAKAHFAAIKKPLFVKALKKTIQIKGLSRRQRLKLAYTAEYAGFSLTEEFPRFDEHLSVGDLHQYFEELSDVALLYEMINKAASTVSQPKILTIDPPKLLQTEASQQITGQPNSAQDLLKRRSASHRKIDTGKRFQIKT